MTRNKGPTRFSFSRRMREIGFLDSGRIKLDFQTEGNTRQVGEKLGIPEIDGNGNCDETRDGAGGERGWLATAQEVSRIGNRRERCSTARSNRVNEQSRSLLFHHGVRTFC